MGLRGREVAEQIELEEYDVGVCEGVGEGAGDVETPGTLRSHRMYLNNYSYEIG